MGYEGRLDAAGLRWCVAKVIALACMTVSSSLAIFLAASGPGRGVTAVGAVSESLLFVVDDRLIVCWLSGRCGLVALALGYARLGAPRTDFCEGVHLWFGALHTPIHRSNSSNVKLLVSGCRNRTASPDFWSPSQLAARFAQRAYFCYSTVHLRFSWLHETVEGGGAKAVPYRSLLFRILLNAFILFWIFLISSGPYFAYWSNPVAHLHWMASFVVKWHGISIWKKADQHVIFRIWSVLTSLPSRLYVLLRISPPSKWLQVLCSIWTCRSLPFIISINSRVSC